MATQASASIPAGSLTADSRDRKGPLYFVGQFIKYALLILMTVILLGPFVLAFFGSFKTGIEVLAYPPTLIPSDWRFDNYSRVWNAIPDTSGDFIANLLSSVGLGGSLFPRWLFNSVFLAAVHVVLQLLLCSMAAFAFARLTFTGKNFAFTVMMSTLMIPGVALLMPRYFIINAMNLVNTYWAVILPAAVGAGGIFILTQFFRSVPKDLEEAAAIDGAGLFTVYWRVILPLAKPALATLAVLEFQGSWNDFQNPLIFLNRQEMFPLTVGLSTLKDQYSSAVNLVLTASMFNTIPAIIIFAIFSRYFVEGSTYAGVKG